MEQISLLPTCRDIILPVFSAAAPKYDIWLIPSDIREDALSTAHVYSNHSIIGDTRNYPIIYLGDPYFSAREYCFTSPALTRMHINTLIISISAYVSLFLRYLVGSLL
jgi:hypothetical protein